MGRLCRHSNSVYLDRYDMDGVCSVLSHRIGGAAGPGEVDERSAHIGAYHALDMMRLHEFRDQEEFFTVFDACAPWRAVEPL